MSHTLEFIAAVPKIVVMRRLDPPAESCACGAILLEGEPSRTFGPVTHGELVCYRVKGEQ